MALYNVIRPGVIVAGKHHTKPSKTPVEVSATEAGPLVEAGVLEPVVLDEFVPGPVVDAKPQRRRRASAADDDDTQSEDSGAAGDATDIGDDEA